MSIMCEECKCTTTIYDSSCGNGCECCNTTTTRTARELLDIIVSDINSLDLTNYHAIYQLGNIANSVIKVIDVAGNEIFNKEEN